MSGSRVGGADSPQTTSALNSHNSRVKIPRMGTQLEWSQTTLINGTVIASTLMPHEHPSLRAPESLSPPCHRWPSKRPHHPILQLVTLPEEEGKVTCSPLPGQTIRLEELLAEGHDVPCLVFKCSIQPAGYMVVLKLLIDQTDKMPSHLHLTEDEYFAADWSKDNLGTTAQMHLSCEADRFKDLASLQGSYVPWSYGFYEFTLPGSPSVVGHLMEYIPSVNIAYFYKSTVVNDPGLVDFFLTALYRMFIEVHRHTVAHQDIALRNIRLHLEKTDNPMQFSLVDFTTSYSINYCKRKDLDWVAAEEPFMELMLDDELDPGSTRAWLASPHGQRMNEDFIKDIAELSLLDR